MKAIIEFVDNRPHIWDWDDPSQVPTLRCFRNMAEAKQYDKDNGSVSDWRQVEIREVKSNEAQAD